MRREVDVAMRETTAALAQMTDLMAFGPRPPRRHGDDPPGRGPAPATDRVMVVAIASNGAVAKRVFDFDRRLIRAWSSGPRATSTSPWPGWASGPG